MCILGNAFSQVEINKRITQPYYFFGRKYFEKRTENNEGEIKVLYFHEEYEMIYRLKCKILVRIAIDFFKCEGRIM